MTLLGLPVRRPVATAMVFCALVLLGVAAIAVIPVELLPPLSGETLWVNFARPGSEPEVVERELLIPLERRVLELEGVRETRGRVEGSWGSLQVVFERGTDVKVRQLELQRIAAELARSQPRGTSVDVNAFDLSEMSRFVLVATVSGGDDPVALRHLVETEIAPRLEAVPGVARVRVMGAAPRQVTVTLDEDLAASLGVDPDRVRATLARASARLAWAGTLRAGTERHAVLVDARPRGLVSLREVLVDPERGVRLGHVARVEMGAGRRETAFLVDGRPGVGLVVFKDEEANLVRLGRELRARIDDLEAEFASRGLRFDVGADAAEMVEDQLHRLERLAAGGFLVALIVLFLFLRQVRAVLVVAIAVPVSLLLALAGLYLLGDSLNLVTLFGLAVGIGMLVDNSIVVHEAVQRRLERGDDEDAAALGGVRRTVRAILAASATNAVVFLPLAFLDLGDSMVRSLLGLVAVAILLPLLGSVLVAVGLVPLLARHLAAPAARARLAALRERRRRFAGRFPPDRIRELFSALISVSLRRPARWLAWAFLAVLLTVVLGIPLVVVGNAGGRQAARADQVRIRVEFSRGRLPIANATGILSRLEAAARRVPGVERTEAIVDEEGGTLTVRFVPEEKRPPGPLAARVREAVEREARTIGGVRTWDAESGGGRGGQADPGRRLLGAAPREITITGPDAERLLRIGQAIAVRLRAIPEVSAAWTGVSERRPVVDVRPERLTLEAMGLTPDRVLPVLGTVRREGIRMATGWVLPDGREIPLVLVSRERPRTRVVRQLGEIPVPTPAGPLPLRALATIRRNPGPPPIVHHDGRREIAVRWHYRWDAPASGEARQALERRVRDAVRGVHLPPGYALDTGEAEATTNWFRKVLVPVVLLLYAVLAITFESLTLPILVLVAAPLTLVGAVWALVVTGLPADMMGLFGALALLGLTVNPAILLVDRMQQRVRAGAASPAAAAFAAVRERARPVLMTTATTVAGLWPMAIPTGRDMEIWPPFAVVVMGGLAASTLMTLLVLPSGFVLLRRLDRVFGRLGPWVVAAWLALVAATIAPLVGAGLLESLTWQIVTTVLVAAGWLALLALAFRRDGTPEPDTSAGPPPVDVRSLEKVYGRPGPLARALALPEQVARRALAAGLAPFDPRDAAAPLASAALVALAGLWLGTHLATFFWRTAWLLVAAAAGARAALALRRLRGRADGIGRVEPGGPEGIVAFALPWVALVHLAVDGVAVPRIAGEDAWIGGRIVLLATAALLTGFVQHGRQTALRLARGELPERPAGGWLRPARAAYRRFCARWFGFDLPRREVAALRGISFRAERGMIGILGPNGAGKTTLLRILAGILDPSRGSVRIGSVRLGALRRQLARWLGYLPQDFGLPGHLTARQYLAYWAILYGIRPAARRRERVERLLAEVGLADRADEPIAGYSGGMRQRVAVARTLLRLPPVIVVDEPTVGLDPGERIRFRNLLVRLARERVVLFSTHVVEDVAVTCPRVLVLSGGRIAWDGPPAELARVAAGRCWEVRLAGAEPAWPAGALVVDRAPAGPGETLFRVLADERPHPAARPAEPTLEDGYLWLMHHGREETR